MKSVVLSSKPESDTNPSGGQEMQSHPLWKYIDMLYGPIRKESINISILELRANGKKGKGKDFVVPALGPAPMLCPHPEHSSNGNRRRHHRNSHKIAAARNIVDRNIMNSSKQILDELVELQSALAKMIDSNKIRAQTLMSRVRKRVNEKCPHAEMRKAARKVEAKYLQRRFAKWNKAEKLLAIEIASNAKDPECHQCRRRKSKLASGERMIHCTHSRAGTGNVYDTGSGLSEACNLAFCSTCLKKVYSLKKLSFQQKWKCPHCRNRCFNFGCLRRIRLQRLRQQFYATPTCLRAEKDMIKRANTLLRRGTTTLHGFCGICLQTEPIGHRSELVQCVGIGCRTLAHLDCVHATWGLSDKSRASRVWMCEACERGEDSERLRCSLCPNPPTPLYHTKPNADTLTRAPVLAFQKRRGESVTPPLSNGTISPSMSNDAGALCQSIVDIPKASGRSISPTESISPPPFPASSAFSASSAAAAARRARRKRTPLFGKPAFVYARTLLDGRSSISNDNDSVASGTMATSVADGKSSWVHAVCLYFATRQKNKKSDQEVGERPNRICPTVDCLCGDVHRERGCVTVRCSFPNCTRRFHPMCGLQARPQLYVRSGKSNATFCEFHHPVREMDNVTSLRECSIIRKDLHDARALLAMVIRRERLKKRILQLDLPLWVETLVSFSADQEEKTRNRQRVTKMFPEVYSTASRADSDLCSRKTSSLRRSYPVRRAAVLAPMSYALTKSRQVRARSDSNDYRKKVRTQNKDRDTEGENFFCGYQCHMKHCFKMTDNVATAAAVAADKASARQAAKNLATVGFSAEKGSVEWLLRSKVAMWDRVRQRQLSVGVYPNLCGIIRTLLAKPNYTVFVGQKSPRSTQRIRPNVVLAALVAIHKHMTGDYFNGAECREKDARLLKEQLTDAVSCLGTSDLIALPGGIAKLIGVKRVRVRPADYIDAVNSDKILFAVRRRYVFRDATVEPVVLNEGRSHKISKSKDDTKSRTSKGDARKRAEYPGKNTDSGTGRSRKRSNDVSASTQKRMRSDDDHDTGKSSDTRCFAISERLKDRYVYNDYGKAMCEYCRQFFHVNGLGPHRSHCSKRPTEVLSASAKLASSSKQRVKKVKKRKVQTADESESDAISAPTKVEVVLIRGKKYVYNADGKVRCNKCGSFFHVNGIGPHKSHCKGTLSLKMPPMPEGDDKMERDNGNASTHAAVSARKRKRRRKSEGSTPSPTLKTSKRKTSRQGVRGGTSYVYNDEGKVMCEHCKCFFHVNGIGPHRAYCERQKKRMDEEEESSSESEASDEEEEDDEDASVPDDSIPLFRLEGYGAI